MGYFIRGINWKEEGKCERKKGRFVPYNLMQPCRKGCLDQFESTYVIPRLQLGPIRHLQAVVQFRALGVILASGRLTRAAAGFFTQVLPLRSSSSGSVWKTETSELDSSSARKAPPASASALLRFQGLLHHGLPW